MERIPASERKREKLRALIEGRGEVEDERSELVRLAARLIIEEALRAITRPTEHAPAPGIAKAIYAQPRQPIIRENGDYEQ
jgi:hypothetical protein